MSTVAVDTFPELPPVAVKVAGPKSDVHGLACVKTHDGTLIVVCGTFPVVPTVAVATFAPSSENVTVSPGLNALPVDVNVPPGWTNGIETCSVGSFMLGVTVKLLVTDPRVTTFPELTALANTS
jgi:hypothetical protein